jgi:murein L,D-transpeptidase YafK
MDVRRTIRVLLLIPTLLVSAAGLADIEPSEVVKAELPKADAVLVRKGERRLYLLRDGQPYREYRIALGGNPVGHKQEEGDLRTPEGDYYIDWRNPDSDFHLSLRISYPSYRDRSRALARGVSPGGMIMIHGQRNGLGWFENFQQLRDWTDGCIAVTNTAIEEIWHAVPDGTPIRIEP